MSGVVGTLQSLFNPRSAFAPKVESSVRRVLVVDDEPSVLEFVDRALRQAGYETVLAESGAAAVAASERSGKFDLLLTDLTMPLMAGDELARLLRQHDPGLRVLYLTGYCDRLFGAKSTLWSDEAFLEKPCSVNGLLEAVSLLIRGRIR